MKINKIIYFLLLIFIKILIASPTPNYFYPAVASVHPLLRRADPLIANNFGLIPTSNNRIGSMDLETLSKLQAIRTNQENAVITQLSQIAPQKRSQLVKEMTNGNSTATNELIKKIIKELMESQNGQIIFPQMAFNMALDRQVENTLNAADQQQIFSPPSPFTSNNFFGVSPSTPPPNPFNQMILENNNNEFGIPTHLQFNPLLYRRQQQFASPTNNNNFINLPQLQQFPEKFLSRDYDGSFSTSTIPNGRTKGFLPHSENASPLYQLFSASTTPKTTANGQLPNLNLSRPLINLKNNSIISPLSSFSPIFENNKFSSNITGEMIKI